MTGHSSLWDDAPREAPKPLWAVALDQMRDYDGGPTEKDVLLPGAAAYALVQHYLETAKLLEITENALRERNSRIGLIKRLAEGKPVTFPDPEPTLPEVEIGDGFGI